MRTKLRSAKVAAGTVVGVLSLTTGLAMAGALPGGAQDVASNVLANVGVSTPTPNSHAGNHPNTHVNSTSAPNQPPNGTKGSAVSSLATCSSVRSVSRPSVSDLCRERSPSNRQPTITMIGDIRWRRETTRDRLMTPFTR